MGLLTASRALIYAPTPLTLDTIEENIRYGAPDATHADVVEAAGSAGAMAFISALPNGLQTRIKGGSSRLSRGERQRVALARALIVRPKLLILDEASASLDVAAERIYLSAITKLARQGMTVIAISHRTSVLDAVSENFVLKDAGLVRRSASGSTSSGRTPPSAINSDVAST